MTAPGRLAATASPRLGADATVHGVEKAQEGCAAYGARSRWSTIGRPVARPITPSPTVGVAGLVFCHREGSGEPFCAGEERLDPPGQESIRSRTLHLPLSHFPPWRSDCRLAGANAVFATTAIKQGEVFDRAYALVIPDAEWQNIERSLLVNYCYPWGNEGALVLGAGSLYNHSYTPNARYIRRMDELVINYLGLRDIPQARRSRSTTTARSMTRRRCGSTS